MEIVPLSVVEAFERPHACACACHAELTLEERAAGVLAMFRFDDAMRGFGYRPRYEPKAQVAFFEQKARNQAGDLEVPVRDEAGLVLAPEAGGEPRVLTEGPADVAPVWSPRGDVIAFQTRVPVLGLSEKESSLEDAFLELTEEDAR